MAYRDAPGSFSAPCHRHASSPAETTCVVCLQPICQICLVYDGTTPTCASCSRRRRRVRRVAQLFAAVASLGLVGGGVAYLMSRPRPFDYGAMATEVRQLADALDREPCDRAQVVKLAEAMNRAGDYRGALGRADAFLRKCGEHPRLRWATYTAHEHLSEWDAAIADASLLITHAPEDPDYWWWRGVIYEQKGELEKAVSDYRKTVELRPTSDRIPFNLSDVLERLGRPCDALAPVLGYLRAYPEQRGKPAIVARVDRLQAACPK